MIRSSATRWSQRMIGKNAASARAANKTASSRKQFSSNPLEADTGKIGTHIHHNLSMSLAVLAPIYFLVPDSYSEGFFGKAFGVVLAGNVSAHSWIGLNHVATDYVPKISKALLGPSRIVIAGMSVVTFLGLSRVSISSKGGIKGCIKGLWNPPSSK